MTQTKSVFHELPMKNHAIICPANQSAERHKRGFAADQSDESGKGRAQSAVLVLLLYFSRHLIFPLVCGSCSKESRSNLNYGSIQSVAKLVEQFFPAPALPASDVALGNTISLKLEPFSADIERKDEADPRPPKQGGEGQGGRWESGWKVVREPAGLADRTDRGQSSAAPRSTKIPRKCANERSDK